jgi:hypothetical protein
VSRKEWSDKDADWFCAACVKAGAGAGAVKGNQSGSKRARDHNGEGDNDDDDDDDDDNSDEDAWGEEEVIDKASAAAGAKPASISGDAGSHAAQTGAEAVAEAAAIKRRLEQLAQKEGKSAKSGASRRTLVQMARKKHGRGRGRGQSTARRGGGRW